MKLLITGALKRNDAFFAKLSSEGYGITYITDERIPLEDQDVDPAYFEGVICNSLFLYTPIERFSSLRFIQLTSAGFDRVPMDYVRAHHIKIHNASGIYSIPLAECAVFGVLQFYKQSRFFAENQRFDALLSERGVPHTAQWGDGCAHEWRYWDAALCESLRILAEDA